MSLDIAMSSLATPTPLELEHVKQMLKRKTELLEDFVLNNNATSTAEKCQILHRRVNLVEQEIARAGITEPANNWLKHAGFEVASLGIPSNSSLNPPKSMGEAGSPAAVSMVAPRPSIPMHIAPASAWKRRSWTGVGSDQGPVLREREGRGSGSSSSPIPVDGDDLLRTSPPMPSTQPSKRTKLTGEEIAPCLRCKILKKKCDSLTQCSHCPQKNCDNGNDYWKVLGCIRGPLQKLSSVFCPDFARSPTRKLKCASEESQIVDFVLTKSTVSAGKRKRILYLLKARDDFSQLTDSSWEDLGIRNSLCRMAAATHALAENELPGEILSLEDHEAAWALLQAVAMDNKYLEQTEYNAFKLIRLGNQFAKENPAPWEIFRKARRLLRQAVEIYLLESLCRHIATGVFPGTPPFDPSRLPASKALILVDIKGDMEDFLDNLEGICSGRAKLTGAEQMSCFYALLVFGIVKSMLIDAYSIRSVSDYTNPWNESYALRITSAFKALVGVFASASKSDVMLQDGRSLERRNLEILRESREMVNVHRWDERGFKTTKDFLLSLGCFVFSGGVYNGFFAQKFGIDAIPKYSPISPSGKTNELRSLRRSSGGHKDMIHTFSVSPKSVTNPHRDQSPISSKTLSPGPETSNQTPNIATDKTSTSSPTPAKFTFVGHNESSKREHCRRRGALDEATLKKSREVRKLGACWNCWLMKVPCSEGSRCDRCKKFPNISILQGCSRAPLTAHSELFFPEFLNSHLDATAMNTYISENVSCSKGQPFPIEVTWIGDPPIKLLASAFVPTLEAEVQQRYQSRSGQLLGVESLPIGFFPLDDSAVERACLRHLESLLENPIYPDLLSGYRSPLAREVLQAISHHYNMDKHPLLHDVLLYHLINDVMSRPILFTELSAANIIEKLGDKYPESSFFSSRLLNRQIKRVINLASFTVLNRVLGHLEKVMRSRQPSLWSVSVSTILILCLSIEQIQTQADAHITTMNASSSLPDHLIQEPQQSCGSLEDMLVSHLFKIFHCVYRTRHSGTNPLAHVLNLKDLNPPEDGPDKEIIGILRSIMFGDNGLKRSHLQESHHCHRRTEEFPKYNSGRLVAKFLSTFNESS